MAQRLYEQYQLDTLVEIQFSGNDRWLRGRVVRHDPPGVWVQTANRRMWFVTNTQRIRKVKEESAED